MRFELLSGITLRGCRKLKLQDQALNDVIIWSPLSAGLAISSATPQVLEQSPFFSELHCDVSNINKNNFKNCQLIVQLLKQLHFDVFFNKILFQQIFTMFENHVLSLELCPFQIKLLQLINKTCLKQFQDSGKGLFPFIWRFTGKWGRAVF